MRLEGIPERLQYPVPAGANLVLVAVISDATPTSVWLATDASPSARRLPLTPDGSGKFQINLGSREVQALTSGQSRPRQFQVFAETVEGELISSIPIVYALRSTHYQRTPVLIVSADGTKRVLHHYQQCDWFDPFNVEQLELELDPVVGAQARIEMGDKIIDLSDKVTESGIIFPMTPEMRAAWDHRGSLLVVVDDYCSFGPHSWRLNVVPRKLDPISRDYRLTVYQRNQAEIPGSNGAYWLRFDDITAGRVGVTVVLGGSRWTLIPRVWVRKGDAVLFALRDETYVVVIEDLVNYLIGDDYGVVTIQRQNDWEQERIDRLLKVIESADVVFLRHGKEHSGREAAEHLREKMRKLDSPVRTLDAFIDEVASRSWLHDEPYRVRRPDGTVLEAGEWLRQQDVGRLGPATVPTPP